VPAQESMPTLVLIGKDYIFCYTEEQIRNVFDRLDEINDSKVKREKLSAREPKYNNHFEWISRVFIKVPYLIVKKVQQV